MGQLVWYHAPMSTHVLQSTLLEIAADIAASGDLLLCERACHALASLLAHHQDCEI